VILITVDCLRADHVGLWGYERPTTPFLDSLAGESIVFRNAVAAGAPTYYALPPILASRYPLALGRDLLGLAPGENTIASVLEENGFATAAFCAGNPYISARFGYDQGFGVFRDFLDQAEFVPEFAPQSKGGVHQRVNQLLRRTCQQVNALGTAFDELYFRYCQRVARRETSSLDQLRRFPAADVIVDHALSWLQNNSGGRFFLWLHFMDPHAPYFPKAAAYEAMGNGGLSAPQALHLNSYWNRGGINRERLAKKKAEVIKLYDAGIRFVDEQIARLAGALVSLNVWDKCALAITADHGEEFLDHGGRFHSPPKLTQELLHVPLLLRAPGASRTEITSPISMLDLAPTLLDMLDISAPADFRGRTWWNSPPLSRRVWPTITECVRACTNPFHREGRLGPRLLAVRKDNYKLVLDFSSGDDQVFDLESDPKELSTIPRGSAKEIRKELLQCARRHVAESHQSRDFDRRQTAQLRDLRLEWAHSAVPRSPN
jgi:arylsulfatase A-like enzyme